MVKIFFYKPQVFLELRDWINIVYGIKACRPNKLKDIFIVFKERKKWVVRSVLLNTNDVVNGCAFVISLLRLYYSCLLLAAAREIETLEPTADWSVCRNPNNNNSCSLELYEYDS